MDYREFNDYELISHIRENIEEANDILYNKCHSEALMPKNPAVRLNKEILRFAQNDIKLIVN